MLEEQKQRILLYATQNEQTKERIQQYFSNDFGDKTVVIEMDAKAVDDYVKKLDDEQRNQNSRKVKSNKERQLAFNQASKLWRILTNNAPFDSNHQLTKKLIVEKTSLSLTQATELLDLLALFGFVEYTKGHYAFRMHFDKDARKDSLSYDIRAKAQEIRDELVEFKRLAKQQEVDELNKEISKLFQQNL